MFKGTPNQSGRPKGAKGKMTTEMRELIFEAIKEGQLSFVERFSSLQNRDFVKYYLELLKLIVPTPKEIITHEQAKPQEIKIVYVDAADEIKRLEELEELTSVNNSI